jgi:XTP/dITP diphosphohydrolase
MSVMGSVSIKRLVIGTRNEGKVMELAELFGTLPVRLASLNEFKNVPEVEETGKTFLENAILKAGAFASATGLPTLADDSGLEVKVLGGDPGVLSARYAGETTTFPEKIERLLSEVEAAGTADRSARFVCSMAVADTDGAILFTADGECRGRLAEAPRGTSGFGYDPIFIPDGYDRTFGELPGDIKQEISHRARASKKIIRYLLDFIEL